jgi:PAS domain S-box-containing protein
MTSPHSSPKERRSVELNLTTLINGKIMEQNNNKIISQIILGQSIGSVRIVVALFVLCATTTKLLYDKYLPDLIDFDEVRWSIIALGCVFFFSTFYKFKTSVFISYISFFLYLSSLVYVISFALINYFDPSAVTILILIIGASTIVINSLTYYGVQSGLIVFASIIVFQSNTLSHENTISFLNLLMAIGVFAIVIIVRLKLVSSVKHSHANLEKLQVLSIVANKHGEIVFVSPTAFSLLGYDPKELLADGWWQSVTVSKCWISREYILDHPNIIGKELVSMECSVVTKDGKTKWLNWANSVLPNGNYMGIALDITKYKE